MSYLLASVKQNYEAQLKAASEQVEFTKFQGPTVYKSYGESLEQYAESEFNKVRSLPFQMPTLRRITKIFLRDLWDFIFRDFDEMV